MSFEFYVKIISTPGNISVVNFLSAFTFLILKNRKQHIQQGKNAISKMFLIVES